MKTYSDYCGAAIHLFADSSSFAMFIYISTWPNTAHAKRRAFEPASSYQYGYVRALLLHVNLDSLVANLNDVDALDE